MSLVLAQPQLDAIADACRQHQVLRMHLFGSALRDDFDPTRSDLDLLVEFQPIESVDLVMADAVRNPYVRRDIEASKRLIYEACPPGLNDYSRSRQISCTNGSLTP